MYLTKPHNPHENLSGYIQSIFFLKSHFCSTLPSHYSTDTSYTSQQKTTSYQQKTTFHWKLLWKSSTAFKIRETYWNNVFKLCDTPRVTLLSPKLNVLLSAVFTEQEGDYWLQSHGGKTTIIHHLRTMTHLTITPALTKIPFYCTHFPSFFQHNFQLPKAIPKKGEGGFFPSASRFLDRMKDSRECCV